MSVTPSRTETTAILISFCLAALWACNAQQNPEPSRRSTDMVALVPDSPPDSIPLAVWTALHSPGNMEEAAPEWSAPFPRNIVVVMFQEQASRDEKQRAVDAIDGVVVGGARLGKGGYYYIRVHDDGTSAPLFRAIRTLKSFPQVESATPELPDISPLGHESGAPAQGDTSRPAVRSLSNLPLDSTFTVEAPDLPRAQGLYYRNIVAIIFDDTTSSTTIRGLLSRYAGTIIGGNPGDEYVVRIPDPGPTFAALESIVTQLYAEPGVALARKVYYRTPVYLNGRPPNNGSVAKREVWGTVLDSANSRPIHPSRVELLGSAVFSLGDSLGRFVLSPVPRGEHVLRVQGIGYFAKDISISVRGDTLRLRTIFLRRNQKLDSLNLIAP